jgi:hypothetical protein
MPTSKTADTKAPTIDPYTCPVCCPECPEEARLGKLRPDGTRDTPQGCTHECHSVAAAV